MKGTCPTHNTIERGSVKTRSASADCALSQTYFNVQAKAAALISIYNIASESQNPSYLFSCPNFLKSKPLRAGWPSASPAT